nr:right-handed parallel beta-helix repeat-containing protein [Methylobacterium brachythecii]
MQSVTPKDNDQFLGEQGAVLNGSKLITDFSKDGQNWVASGQTQEGFRQGTDEGAPGAERAGYPETFFIDDKPLTPVDSLAQVAPGKFYFDYAADKIYFQNDPTGHKVEAGVSPFAIGGAAKGVVVQNLVVEKYDVPAQAGAIGYNSSAEGWTIQNNEVRLNYGVGIYSGSNGQVKGNYVHDNGQMGLGASGDNVLIQGNEIAHNGYFSGINRGWEGGGAKFAETNHLTVSDNYSHDNNGYGLWTDINNINTLYDGNTVTNNISGGINHEISYDATIRNNVVTGNGTEGTGWLWNGGIQIQNSQNVDVYGNHVDASAGGNAISLIQQDRGTGSHGPWVTTGNSVHDNVIVDGTPGSGASGSIADYDQSGLAAGGNTFNNNQYYVSDPSGDHFAWTNGFYDWNQYRQVSGQDANSTLSTGNPGAPAIPSSAASTSAPVVSDPDQASTTPAAAHTDPVATTDPSTPVTSHTDPIVVPSTGTVATPVTADPSTTSSPVTAVSSDPETQASGSGESSTGAAVTPTPGASADPVSSTTGASAAAHDGSASGSAHSWASHFFGEHHGSSMLAALQGHGSSGSQPEIGGQFFKNVLQQYHDLASQHGAGHTQLDGNAVGELFDQLHHAKMGDHSSLAM